MVSPLRHFSLVPEIEQTGAVLNQKFVDAMFEFRDPKTISVIFPKAFRMKF